MLNEFNRAFEHFLRTIPAADERQINAEVVTSDRRHHVVVGVVVVVDGFFEAGDSFVRLLQPTARGGHVRIDFSEHEVGWMIADQLQRVFEILDG